MDKELFKFRINKYLSQYQYLQHLLFETKYLFDKYNETFLKEYYGDDEIKKHQENKQDEYNKKQEETKEEDNKEETEDKEGKDDKEEKENGEVQENEQDDEFNTQVLSKLYKKLSLKTHPDKVPDKIDLFKKITSSYKKKDLITLILIAQELNVDIINIVDIENQKIIDILNKNIETINKEINELQNTLAWHWANATDDDKKLYKEKNKEI